MLRGYFLPSHDVTALTPRLTSEISSSSPMTTFVLLAILIAHKSDIFLMNQFQAAEVLTQKISVTADVEEPKLIRVKIDGTPLILSCPSSAGSARTWYYAKERYAPPRIIHHGRQLVVVARGDNELGLYKCAVRYKQRLGWDYEVVSDRRFLGRGGKPRDFYSSTCELIVYLNTLVSVPIRLINYGKRICNNSSFPSRRSKATECGKHVQTRERRPRSRPHLLPLRNGSHSQRTERYFAVPLRRLRSHGRPCGERCRREFRIRVVLGAKRK